MPERWTIAELDPAIALRAGRFDPVAVLVLWCARKAFLPLLWLGMIFATLSGRSDEIDEAGGLSDYMASRDGAGEMVAAVLSPLIIVFLAFGLRILVAGLALAFAYPLTTWTQPADYAHGRTSRSRTRLWSDRWHMARAYRSLRSTWVVRQEAVERLGDLGQQLVRCRAVLRWASIVLFIVYLATIVLTADPWDDTTTLDGVLEHLRPRR